MLYPDEFTVGMLADAAPGSLFLPQREHDPAFLIGEVNGTTTAAFLTGPRRYKSVPCAGTARWTGLIIQNIRVEVDVSSLLDPFTRDNPAGALVRVEDHIAFVTSPNDWADEAELINLANGLMSTGKQVAGFTKWRVVIGDGAGKRVLYEVDVSEPAPRR